MPRGVRMRSKMAGIVPGRLFTRLGGRAADRGEVATGTPMALMKRYVVDYTNAHDLRVCDEIMSPAYRFQVGADSFSFADYKELVRQAFDRFPDLQLAVHEICWSGRRIAMRFSETATSPRHGSAAAVWSGIALYHLDKKGRLASCVVNQDFYGRREQLRTGQPAPEEPRHPDPWSTPEEEPDVAGEAVARAWLAGEDRGQAVASVADDQLPPLLSGWEIRVVDLFSAGDRVAAAFTIQGEYSGGLADVDDAAIGTHCRLEATALLHVADTWVVRANVVSDRYGLRRRLRHQFPGQLTY